MHQSWVVQSALFMLSQTLSLLGSSLVQYALLWHVTLHTGSGVMMTVYIVAGFLPTFVLSPFAGVWADRYDRKSIIILADGGIAFFTLALAIFFSNTQGQIWIIFVAAALRSLGTAAQGPAVGAVLPQLVPEKKLMRVNGIFGTIQSLIALGAPFLSGVLLTVSSLSLLFFIDVVTALLAIAVLVFLVKIPRTQRQLAQESGLEVKPTSYWKDLKAGFQYIGSHGHLISFFLFIAIILVLVTPAAFLTPLQAARTYGEEIWRLTAIEMAYSVGMMLGGGLLAIWGGFKNRMRTMVLSTSLMAVCTISLGMAPRFWIYLLFMVVFGIALALYNTPSQVILQEHVEDAYLGRVFSVSTMLFTSIMPLAMLFFGPLADIVSVELLLITTGSLMAAMSLVVPSWRHLMAAGIPRT